MIRRVGSTDERFRTVEFHDGINVVLAVRANGSSDKASTNATGKTALLEIINFCFGADLPPLKTLSKQNLSNHAFFLEFTVGDRELAVQRGLDLPRVVRVRGLSEQEEAQVSIKNWIEDAAVISLEDWRTLLGRWFFDVGLPGLEKAPSFRALFAYFARYPEMAYLSAKSTVPREKDWAAERKYAYLLQLNWALVDAAIEHRSEADKLGSDESGFRQLARRLGAEGESESELAADLDFRRAEVEKTAGEAREALSRFRVLPEYEEEERRANELAATMQGLRKDLLVRSRILEDYRSSAREADDVTPQSVVDLYEAADIELHDAIKRGLDEVVEFHRSLVVERQAFLATEITRIYREEADLRARFTTLDEEKAGILQRLEGAKALPEYTQLSNRANELQAKAQQLRDSRQIYNDLLKRKSDLNFRRADLVNRFTVYDLENREHYDNLVGLYSDMSSDLHETTAQLVVRTEFPKKQGLPKYFVEVKIDGKGATGRVRCEIFLFDLLLARLWAPSHPNTIVLLHDSIMYDSMDPRQRAHSVVLGRDIAKATNFQYIVMLNESEWPVEQLKVIAPEWDYTKAVAHVVDDSELGGLFGFRFDDNRYIDHTTPESTGMSEEGGPVDGEVQSEIRARALLDEP